MRSWRGWRYSWCLVAVAVSACGSGSAVPQPQAIQQRLTLQGFNSCQDLETYIEDTAVLDMRTQLEAYKKDSWGWGWGFGGRGEPEMAATMDGSGAPPSAGPSDYTTTNTQVLGVDEADFVKNDGTRIFVLSGQRLFINQSWPAADLGNISSLQIEGWPREMFLDENDRVVVFSTVYHPYGFDQTYGDVWCDSMYCGYYYANTVKVTVVDVTNLASPQVVQEHYLPGAYSNSRRIGASVRVVLSDHFRWPSGVKWWPESYDQSLFNDKSRWEKAIDALIAQNEQVIRAATLEQWLPAGKRRVSDGQGGHQIIDVGYDCTDFYRSNAPTKLGLVTVATLNLDNPTVINRTSVVAQSGEVYASAQHLYVANYHWWWWPQPGQRDFTYVHKFDITQPDNAHYVASGGVEGHIVDQFSMDENSAGFFRVATTLATRVEDPNTWWGRLETTNRVSVLAEINGALTVVGQTPEMAPGERITSSRFVENKGYVVTFEQVDPLFTLDLTDPLNPTIVGELKIPGFSTYIHPMGPDHLLTIGTHIDENLDWRTRAVKITVFDVSNMAAPREAFTQHVGSAYGYSEAQWNHKAFNYFPAKKLLAVPFWDYDSANRTGDYWSSFVSDLRVFHIDTVAGITPMGAVSMKDMYVTQTYYDWSWYWLPSVRRSVMADDYVYAISDAGIRVAHISDLSVPLATVQFPRSNP
jgi:uncharacterized secreted protein with C-terminal beta-propeller domain